MVNAYEGAIILVDVLLLIVRIIFWTLEGIYRTIVPPEEKNVNGEIVLLFHEILEHGDDEIAHDARNIDNVEEFYMKFKVTGAGHGIGRELALKYASLGATVVCWDLNPQGNQETLAEIKKLGATSVHAYQCDVSNRDQVFKTAEKVKSEVGNVTILVNNAGIMPCHSFLDTTVDEISKIFDINVLAHFWMLKAFLPSMIEKDHGHIVALSSIAGVLGLANLVPYCSSKFAVRGMMEALNEELRGAQVGPPSDIKFTTVFPYMVDTGLCKKPRIRFPSLMSLVTAKEAARQIVSAQRRNYTEVSIPSYWLRVNSTLRNFPEKVWVQIKDFLDAGVETDL